MLLKRGGGDLAQSGSGRVWILKEEPMGCANELQVGNERGRVNQGKPTPTTRLWRASVSLCVMTVQKLVF